MKKSFLFLILLVLMLTGCAQQASGASAASVEIAPNPTVAPMQAFAQPDGPGNQVPVFEHIIMIVLENKDYQEVIDSQSMPFLNDLARKNVLLSNYYAVRHPSLPNYIALVSGDTHGITKDCTDCFIDQPNLADLIEASGRTWKTYQEDLPYPCYIGDARPYYQKHNPFIYFNNIRQDPTRCQRGIVPLTNLEKDLAASQLPDFSFIVPNICNSGHDCLPETTDLWLKGLVTRLQASPALGSKSLIVVTYDEGGEKSTGSCCGLNEKAGGQIATVLVSPLARPGFMDGSPYSHYSLLKTILTAWSLPDLANTSMPGSQPIVAPWIGSFVGDANGIAQAQAVDPSDLLRCVPFTPGSGTDPLTLCLSDPPDTGSPLAGDVTVTASLGPSRGSGVQRMVFSLDGEYLLSDYQAPYTFKLPTAQWADGSHTLSVEALMRDASGSAAAGLRLEFGNGNHTPAVQGVPFQPAFGRTPVGGEPFNVAVAGDGAGGEINTGKVADLIESFGPDLLLYLGDVYERGSAVEFANWYDDLENGFGRFRAITNPTVGNHEYLTPGAAGYFGYWNGIPDYYSYDAGGWHFISLNSNYPVVPVGQDSAQYQWLSDDLAAHSQACTIVYYHHPLFNAGREEPAGEMTEIWKLLNRYRVSIVLNGHDHTYQRWHPLDGQGLLSSNGITEFVVGTSGHGLQTIRNNDRRLAFALDTNPAAFGALLLQLHPNGAAFSYRGLNGSILDSGVIPCGKGAQDTQSPGEPGGLTATATGATQVQLNWLPASEDTGVASYLVYRDGIEMVRLPGATLSYVDTTVQPLHTYYYTVIASDLVGNRSPGSIPAIVNTPEVASLLTIPVAADTYVNITSPDANYGRIDILRADGSPEMRSYLRFDVRGLAGKSVTGAHLMIYANSGSGQGLSVAAVTDNSWDEAGLTYASAPVFGPRLASSGSLAKPGGWVSLDVTGYITGEGSFSFGISTEGATSISFAAHDSGVNVPYLVIDLN